MDDLSGKGCGCVHPRPTKVTISRYIFSVFFMAGGVLFGPFGLVKFWYVSAGAVRYCGVSHGSVSFGKAGEVSLAGLWWGALRCVALGQARWCSLGWG